MEFDWRREDIGGELLLPDGFDDDGFADVEDSPIDADMPAEFFDVPATIDDDFESFELELAEELILNN